MLAGPTPQETPEPEHQTTPWLCEERYRLLDAYLEAVRELTILHTRQTEAVIAGERDLSRFDDLILVAQEKRETAKYAWIAHVEQHRCESQSWRVHAA